MTPRQRHDATVDRLATDLSALFGRGAEYTVLTRPRWQFLDGFPDCITTFDLAVIRANPQWLVSADGPVLGPDHAPVTAVNVVEADTLEGDTIRIPNTLVRTAVSEYVLFDPTGDALRPVFQTSLRRDNELVRLWPGFHGVFFSCLDFRLDVRGHELVASACGRGRVEEELFVLRWERERIDPADTMKRAGLDERIAKLESRRLQRRPTWDEVAP